MQTRRVFCAAVTDDGISKVEDDKCDLEKKYNGLKNCTAEVEECRGEWFSGPWSKVIPKAFGDLCELANVNICFLSAPKTAEVESAAGKLSVYETT